MSHQPGNAGSPSGNTHWKAPGTRLPAIAAPVVVIAAPVARITVVIPGIEAPMAAEPLSPHAQASIAWGWSPTGWRQQMAGVPR